MARTQHFATKTSFGYGPQGATTSYRVYDCNSPLSCVLESVTSWPTRDEAQAAAERCNAGDRSGIEFATYADD